MGKLDFKTKRELEEIRQHVHFFVKCGFSKQLTLARLAKQYTNLKQLYERYAKEIRGKQSDGI